jgi:hypothetical protein
MPPLIDRLRLALGTLWRGDAALTASGLIFLAALTAFTVGLVVDPRTITGMPAWMKPAKFAVSTAIYTFTLAWIFTYLRDWPRMRRLIGRGTAFVLLLEVAIIAAQAWRGTTSHFNTATALDATLFSIMGSAILAQTLASLAVIVALWKQPFADAALGWAFRLGFAITIVGAMTGGLMTRPTSAQLDDVRATGRMPIVGAHTVGAPDGGPGLPGTGWSRTHGDLRVPHFVGLHALQVLPLAALALRRRRLPGVARVRLTFVAAAAYASLFVLLLVQALRGQSAVAPDALTFATLGIWLVSTVAAARAIASATQRSEARYATRGRGSSDARAAVRGTVLRPAHRRIVGCENWKVDVESRECHPR